MNAQLAASPSTEHACADPRVIVRTLLSSLPTQRFRYSNEQMLHRGLMGLFESLSIEYEHEKVAGRDRFDFLLERGVVVEVKVDGSLQSALSQAERYIKRVDVSAVIVLSTKAWARGMQPKELSGKPFHVVHLQRVSF